MSDEATCNGGLQVEAEAFTEEEIARIRKYARQEDEVSLRNRFLATIRAVEGRRDELVACANALIDEVASLRKERDAAMAVAELFLDGDDPKKMARSYRAHAVFFGGQGKEDRAARCVARAEALEALPEVAP